VTKVLDKNDQFIQKMDKENAKKQELRVKIVELQKTLRETERQVVEVNLEKNSLSSLVSGE
jgi:seryl-tRNA synthetase